MDSRHARTCWVVACGQEVSVGDVVAVDSAPDAYAKIIGTADKHGIPRVTFVEGPQVGATVELWPSQILHKRLRRPTDG